MAKTQPSRKELLARINNLEQVISTLISECSLMDQRSQGSADEIRRVQAEVYKQSVRIDVLMSAVWDHGRSAAAPQPTDQGEK